MSDTWETYETVRVVLDDDGVKRWKMETDSGLCEVGGEDNTVIEISTDSLNDGSYIVLTVINSETSPDVPDESADKPHWNDKYEGI